MENWIIFFILFNNIPIKNASINNDIRMLMMPFPTHYEGFENLFFCDVLKIFEEILSLKMVFRYFVE